MNSEIIVISSIKDGNGIGLLDIETCSQSSAGFKNCVADSGCMCQVWCGPSSYSGEGSCGDYLAVAQSKKPVIHVYQWGKPQIHFQCHTQEIVTSMTSCLSFLVGGTKRGWIYVWDVTTGALLQSWQAHFKSINRMSATKNSQFLISVSEDGTGKVWDTSKLLDESEFLKLSAKGNVGPFRSWNPHSLSIRDMSIIDSMGVLRVVTCSLDKTVVVYDVFSQKQCMRLSLPEPLECVATSPGEDFIFAGGSSGKIYSINSSVASTAASATLSGCAVFGNGRHFNPAAGAMTMESRLASKSNVADTGGISESGSQTAVGYRENVFMALVGHTKAVTALAFSKDNSTLVSSSLDGTLRTWNIWMRQCLHQCTPMSKCGISNLLIINCPELIGQGAGVKPSLCPIQHIKKYSDNDVGELHGTKSAASAPKYPFTSSNKLKIVLGETFMGYQRVEEDTFRATSFADYDMLLTGASLISNSEAGYVPFDVSTGDAVDASSLTRSIGSVSDPEVGILQREISMLRQTVNELSSENEALSRLNTNLNSHLKSCVGDSSSDKGNQRVVKHVHLQVDQSNAITSSSYTNRDDIGDANDLIAAAATAVASLLQRQISQQNLSDSYLDASVGDEGNEHDLHSVATELEEARKVIVKLHEDNNEWKHICSRMKQHLRKALLSASDGAQIFYATQNTDTSSSVLSDTSPGRRVQLKNVVEVVELPPLQHGDIVGDARDLSSAASAAVQALKHHTECQQALAAQELVEARKVIAKLHEDNSEWRHICSRMKTHIEQVVANAGKEAALGEQDSGATAEPESIPLQIVNKRKSSQNTADESVPVAKKQTPLTKRCIAKK